jgi:hypothetical protein
VKLVKRLVEPEALTEDREHVGFGARQVRPADGRIRVVTMVMAPCGRELGSNASRTARGVPAAYLGRELSEVGVQAARGKRHLGEWAPHMDASHLDASYKDRASQRSRDLRNLYETDLILTK